MRWPSWSENMLVEIARNNIKQFVIYSTYRAENKRGDDGDKRHILKK